MGILSETLTLVHPVRTKTGESYVCTAISDASYHATTTIAAQERGSVAENTVRARLPADCMPGVGDYLVRGALEAAVSTADFAEMPHCTIQSVADNRRGYLPHWAVVGG